MDESRLRTIAQVEEFLSACALIEFSPAADDDQRYAHKDVQTPLAHSPAASPGSRQHIAFDGELRDFVDGAHAIGSCVLNLVGVKPILSFPA